MVDVAAVAVPRHEGQPALSVEGRPWRRLWSLADRLVVDFLGTVVVEVRDADGQITFDRELAPDVEEHLLLDHILPLVLARRGETVLHGAVLSLDERSAVLAGPSGSGKSTLTVFAGARGWVIAGDDGAVVQAQEPVTVEPTYPTVRLWPDALGLLGRSPDEGSPVIEKRRLTLDGPNESRQKPKPLQLVVVLEPAPADAAATFTAMRGVAAHAALFGSTFHADLRDERALGNVVQSVARIVSSTSVGRLVVPRGSSGLAEAERVLRRAMQEPPAR